MSNVDGGVGGVEGLIGSTGLFTFGGSCFVGVGVGVGEGLIVGVGVCVEVGVGVGPHSYTIGP